MTTPATGIGRMRVFGARVGLLLLALVVSTLRAQQTSDAGRASGSAPSEVGRGQSPTKSAAGRGLPGRRSAEREGGSPGNFDRDVRPLLTETCQACHNATAMTAGLDMTPLLDPSSVLTRRETWERIVA
jgi:hypothetical protein